MRICLAIYWLMGCWLIGSVYGEHAKACPTDELPMMDIAASVVVWPALAFAGYEVRNEPHRVWACKK